eukprot:snap_masked-scaffold_16-processed-gene-2.26-mRNA-1 protein AED:0.37 eAED:0.43 QI:0/-1/0/1/-1/1/1/0/166
MSSRVNRLHTQLTSEETKGNKDIVERALKIWHETIDYGFSVNVDNKLMLKKLDNLLSSDIVFRAPTYWKTRKDKSFTVMALLGVTKAFTNFKYRRTFINFEKKAFVLEFSCQISRQGKTMDIRGVDIVTVDEDSKVCDLEVIIRPPAAALMLKDIQGDFFEKLKQK